MPTSASKPGKTNPRNRRKFIKSLSAGTAGWMIVPRSVIGGKGYIAPSDRVNVAIIGAGGKGRQNAESLLELEDVQITSVTDPGRKWDLNRFYYRSIAGREPVADMIQSHYKGKGGTGKIDQYKTFREFMEHEKDADAVVCSTPDHTHAYITIASLKAGRHVYCEKPLAHNIYEARVVGEVVRETGLATQMGNVGHSRDGMRSTVEYLRDGAIGRVTDIHTWVPATRWNPGVTGLPEKASPLPDDFIWEEWLGPAPLRPYNELFSPVTWRDFWIYGSGALGDFGCHDMDAATWAFHLKSPSSVQIHPAGQSNNEIIPYGESGVYVFPKRGNQPEVRLHWYSGGLKPDWNPYLPEDYEYGSRSAMFVGEKGVIINDGGNRAPEIFPLSLRESYTPPAESIPRSGGHYRDWIDAIKNGGESSANLDYGSRLTELTLLGVLSLRLGGRRIDWDADQMKVTNIEEAKDIVREPARKGWDISELV